MSDGQDFANEKEIQAFIAECLILCPNLHLSIDPEHRRAEDKRLVLSVTCGSEIIEQGHIGLGQVRWHTLYLMKSGIENAYKAGVQEGLQLAADRLHKANNKIIGARDE